MEGVPSEVRVYHLICKDPVDAVLESLDEPVQPCQLGASRILP